MNCKQNHSIYIITSIRARQYANVFVCVCVFFSFFFSFRLFFFSEHSIYDGLIGITEWPCRNKNKWRKYIVAAVFFSLLSFVRHCRHCFLINCSFEQQEYIMDTFYESCVMLLKYQNGNVISFLFLLVVVVVVIAVAVVTVAISQNSTNNLILLRAGECVLCFWPIHTLCPQK